MRVDLADGEVIKNSKLADEIYEACKEVNKYSMATIIVAIARKFIHTQKHAETAFYAIEKLKQDKTKD